MGEKYAVSCLLEHGIRVRATRKDFDTEELAIKYALTVAEGRYPQVHMLCHWCGKGWNVTAKSIHRDAAPERVDNLGWYCSECGGC